MINKVQKALDLEEENYKKSKLKTNKSKIEKK